MRMDNTIGTAALQTHCERNSGLFPKTGALTQRAPMETGSMSNPLLSQCAVITSQLTQAKRP